MTSWWALRRKRQLFPFRREEHSSGGKWMLMLFANAFSVTVLKGENTSTCVCSLSRCLWLAWKLINACLKLLHTHHPNLVLLFLLSVIFTSSYIELTSSQDHLPQQLFQWLAAFQNMIHGRDFLFFFLLHVLNVKLSEWEETFGKYLDTAKLQICKDQKAGSTVFTH